MSETTAQVLLAFMLLTAAIAFVILGAGSLAAGLVGAVCGQGLGLGVQKAVTNGNGK